MSAAGSAIAALIFSGAAALPVAAADMTPDGRPAAPVTAERRYRLSAAIRPLLFWVGAKNVGGARIVWRQDGGAAGLRAAPRLRPGPGAPAHQPLGLGPRGR